MKKILLLILFVAPLFVFSQTYILNAKNNNFIGYNKFPATKTKIGNTSITETKVQAYDANLADSLAAEDYLVFINDSLGTTDNYYVTPYDYIVEVNRSNTIKMLKLNGYNTFSYPVVGTGIANTQAALSDGNMRGGMYYIEKDTIVTGVIFSIYATGDYTADNYNGVILFRISNDTLYSVASTTNDGDIWKGATSTLFTVPFATPYTATKGLYYIACLYNSSVQITAPSLPVNEVVQYITNASCRHWLTWLKGSVTSVPTYVKKSDVGATTNHYAFKLY